MSLLQAARIGCSFERMEISRLKAKLSRANEDAREWKEKAKSLERILTTIEGISVEELRALYKLDRR